MAATIKTYAQAQAVLKEKYDEVNLQAGKLANLLILRRELDKDRMLESLATKYVDAQVSGLVGEYVAASEAYNAANVEFTDFRYDRSSKVDK